MSLDDYLHRFAGHRRITLVGPTLAQPLPPDPLEEPVIWVDGGADLRRAGDGEGAGFAVGDGDSCRAKLDQYLDTDKDHSDLAYVLGRLPEHFTELILLGFLGDRRDHELFNLGEVHHFLAAAKAPARARFDRDLDVYSAGRWTFEAHGVFSLAVMAPTTVHLAGACKYPITPPAEIAPLRSLGLSNLGFGEITLTTRGPAFIFQSPV